MGRSSIFGRLTLQYRELSYQRIESIIGTGVDVEDVHPGESQ